MMPPFDLFTLLPPAAAVPAGEAAGTLSGLLLYITLALAVSFLCSILEAALLSTSHSHIQLLIEADIRSGRLMQDHKANVERPISAILTLNTIAHTVGAAGAGAEAAAIFGSEWIGVISAVLTLLILVFSEIIPKTLGAVYWKQLTPFTAYAIRLLVLLLFPAVWAFEQLTQLMRPEEVAPTVTRSELEVLARISAEEGALQERENRILTNLLQLQNAHVYDIMTPRKVLMALREDLTVREVLEQYPVLPYSRIPIYSENMDDIGSFVLRHDIFRRGAGGQMTVTLRELGRKLHAIPETNTIARALDEFIARQQHIFLAFDEHGGTAGILTLEDCIESLLGIEITDESDIAADLRQLAQQRYSQQMALLEQVEPPDKPDETAPQGPGAEGV